jgi:hypothetical protein
MEMASYGSGDLIHRLMDQKCGTMYNQCSKSPITHTIPSSPFSMV